MTYSNEHLEQYIMSPNYPDPYPNNYEEVIWFLSLGFPMSCFPNDIKCIMCNILGMETRVNKRGTCHTHIYSIWYVWSLPGWCLGRRWWGRNLWWILHPALPPLWRWPHPRHCYWHYHHSQALHKWRLNGKWVLCRGYRRCDCNINIRFNLWVMSWQMYQLYHWSNHQ